MAVADGLHLNYLLIEDRCIKLKYYHRYLGQVAVGSICQEVEGLIEYYCLVQQNSLANKCAV